MMNKGSGRGVAFVCVFVAWISSDVSVAGTSEGGAPSPTPPLSSWAVLNPTNKADLAVFAEGPWKGKNAVFQAPAFDLTMDGTGRIELQPKTNGVRAGKAILVAFGCHYYDPKIGNTVGRPIVDFTEAPTPKVYTAAGMIKLSGIFDDKVQFTVTVTYAETSLSINCKIKDPPGLKIASNCGYHARIGPMYQITAERSFEQVKALVSGMSLELTALTGDKRRYAYWQDVGSQRVQQVWVHGPWGDRDITIRCPMVLDRKTGKKQGGYFSIYGGGPYMGFHVGRAVKSGEIGGKLEVEFEQ